MRYGKFLKKHGTIGFVAPSYGAYNEPYASIFNKALEKFMALEYDVSVGPNCRKGDGIGISTRPEDCGAEVNAAFANEDIDVIISTGGGELMCETLAYMDFWGIAARDPKWYMGFSDNTNLTFLLPTLCDTAAIYGPNACAFGQEPWHESINDALKVLTGEKLTVRNYKLWEKESLRTPENPYATINATEPVEMKVYDKGKYKEADRKTSFSGRLLGGCLDVLTNIVGTKYDGMAAFNKRYEDEGIVWFLESCDLNPYDVRRALWHLHSAGWFNTAKGFLIGRPMHFGEEMPDLNMYDAVTGILGRYNVPIIMDCDIGHLSPMMTLISGCKAGVNFADGELSITQHLEA
ncbi:MAG: LD-carboxypeptidase [Lachnospiraceae bacterium]|nr:LD-carboxypeptidase [Lachnospiraceae bacterium]